MIFWVIFSNYTEDPITNSDTYEYNLPSVFLEDSPFDSKSDLDLMLWLRWWRLYWIKYLSTVKWIQLLINFHNKRYVVRLTEGNIKLLTYIQKLCAYFSQHTAAVPIAIQWMPRFWKINHCYYTWNKRSNHNYWKYVVS